MLALLISGGMLIPGNIPNIIAANRLGISSRELTCVGLPICLPLMLACFIVLHGIGQSQRGANFAFTDICRRPIIER